MQMTAALHDIHKAGFVYRDVKPANIMRCGDGPETRYRLIDFGSAVGIGGCLFGGSNGHRDSRGSRDTDFSGREKDFACNLDPHPAQTRERISHVFRSLCGSSATARNTKLSADKLVEGLRATGASMHRATRVRANFLQKFCSCSSSSTGDASALEGSNNGGGNNALMPCLDLLGEEEGQGGAGGGEGEGMVTEGEFVEMFAELVSEQVLSLLAVVQKYKY